MALGTADPRARSFSMSLVAGAGNAPAQRLDLQHHSTMAQPANALPRDVRGLDEIYAIMNSERNRRSMSPVELGYVEDVFNVSPPATERVISNGRRAPAVEDTAVHRNSQPHVLITPPEDRRHLGDVDVVSHNIAGHTRAPFNTAGQTQATSQLGRHVQTRQQTNQLPPIQPHEPFQNNPAPPNGILGAHQAGELCYPDPRSPSPPAGFIATRNGSRPSVYIDRKGSPISTKQVVPPKALYPPSLSRPTAKASAASRTLDILATSRHNTTYQFRTNIDVRQGVSRFIPSSPTSQTSPTNRNIALTAGRGDDQSNVTIGRKHQNAPLARQQPVLLARLPARKISPLTALASGQAMSYSRVGRVERAHQATGDNRFAQNKGMALQGTGNARETRNARVLPDFLAKYEPTHYFTAEPPSNFHGTKIDWLEAVYKCLCNEHEALKQLAKYTKESLVVANQNPQQVIENEGRAPAQHAICSQAPPPRSVVAGHQEYSPSPTPTPRRPSFRLAPAKFTPQATSIDDENRPPALATPNPTLAPINLSQRVAAPSLPSLNVLGLLPNAVPRPASPPDSPQPINHFPGSQSLRPNGERFSPEADNARDENDNPTQGSAEDHWSPDWSPDHPTHRFTRLYSDSPIDYTSVRRRSRSCDENSQSGENGRPTAPHRGEDGQDSDRENVENVQPGGHTEEHRRHSPDWGRRSPVHNGSRLYSGSPINYNAVRRRSRSNDEDSDCGENVRPRTLQRSEDGQDSDRENAENNPPEEHTEDYRPRSPNWGRRSPVHNGSRLYSGSPINYSPVGRMPRSSDEDSESRENRRPSTLQDREDHQDSDRENVENNPPEEHAEDYRTRNLDRGRRYSGSSINYSPDRHRSRSRESEEIHRRSAPRSSEDGQESDRENVEPRNDGRHVQEGSSDGSGSSRFSPVSNSFVAVEWSPIWNNNRDAERKRGRTDNEDEERRSSDEDSDDDDPHTPQRPRFGAPSRKRFETIPCTPEPDEATSSRIERRQPDQITSPEARWVGEDQRRAELDEQRRMISRMQATARDARSALSTPSPESASTARAPRPEPEVKKEKSVVPIPREALRRLRALSQARSVKPEPNLQSGIPLGVGEHKEFNMATYECHESASQAGVALPGVRQTRSRTRALAQAQSQAQAQAQVKTKQSKARVARKPLPIPRNIRARSRVAADVDVKPGGSGLSNEEKEVIAGKRTRNARRK